MTQGRSYFFENEEAEDNSSVLESFFHHLEELDPEYYDPKEASKLHVENKIYQSNQSTGSRFEEVDVDLVPTTLTIVGQVNTKKGKFFYKT